MKRSIILIITLVSILGISSSVVHADPSFGKRTKINEGWRFMLDSVGNYSSPSADDSSWRMLSLPHDWSVEGKASPTLASCTGYLPGGIGWYRKTLDIPKSEQGRRQYLYFEGVYNNSEVWINGKSVGKRPNGYVSFLYDITPWIDYGGRNTVAVKVDHSKSADSRWYTGSGIYRDVYLVTANPVHIDQWGLFATSPVIEKGRAVIAVQTRIINNGKADSRVSIEHKLFEKEGKAMVASAKGEVSVSAGKSSDAKLTLEVPNPRLWSVDYPNLYRIETSVYENGKKIDGTTTVTGIREARFDPDKGFFLNGKNLKLKGVCLHHDAGSLGSAVPPKVWERRLEALREIGCNAIRMSHNPQATALYELCDRMGFLVMDEAFDEWEFPKRKWIEGWNVGKNPGYQGTSEYFKEWGERDLSDMVLKNRNHPCIVMWSIGNEVDYPNDPYSHPILDKEGINQKTIPGYKPERPRAEQYGRIATNFVKVVKGIDTTRAITGALAGVVMSNYTDYPAALDAVGYNYTEQRYAMDHKTYPDRVIYGSENRHEYSHWTAVRDNDFISGQFLWTGIDYLGEALKWPSRGFGSGIVDLAGFIKTRGYYRQSLWSDEPMVYIATSPVNKIDRKTLLFDLKPQWKYAPEDGDIRVAAFSNCEEVMLFLNGKRVSFAPQRDEVSNALYWDIPYTEGELKAVGLIDAENYAEHILDTHGPAASIKVSADTTRLNGRDDLAHVVIELLDRSGNPAADARNPLAVKVSGAGKLLGLENGDSRHMEGFTGNNAPAYRGRLLAYVVPTADKGTIDISVSGDGLPESTISIKIKK